MPSSAYLFLSIRVSRDLETYPRTLNRLVAWRSHGQTFRGPAPVPQLASPLGVMPELPSRLLLFLNDRPPLRDGADVPYPRPVDTSVSHFNVSEQAGA